MVAAAPPLVKVKSALVKVKRKRKTADGSSSSWACTPQHSKKLKLKEALAEDKAS
jgi:hypothetical protein